MKRIFTGLQLTSLALTMCLSAFTFAANVKPNPDLDRLNSSLATLDADPALADLGAVERLKARQALAQFISAKGKLREQALFVANKRVETAQAAAQAELLGKQSEQLDRERDKIMLQASQRDAEMARREADQLRLQNMARQEEAERLSQAVVDERTAREQSTADAQLSSAQAVQARKLADARAREVELARKEAELASILASDNVSDGDALPPMQRRGNSTVYTLAGNSFASGSASLTSSAQSSLNKLAAILRSGQGSIRIEGFTDNKGADAANLALSQRRATAVLIALRAGGLASTRLKASGMGKAQPVADNGSEAGRARNRRVEIILN
jgi:outer membrane protein OmpA-like peptidoglycan-associated protein